MNGRAVRLQMKRHFSRFVLRTSLRPSVASSRRMSFGTAEAVPLRRRIARGEMATHAMKLHERALGTRLCVLKCGGGPAFKSSLLIGRGGWGGVAVLLARAVG